MTRDFADDPLALTDSAFTVDDAGLPAVGGGTWAPESVFDRPGPSLVACDLDGTLLTYDGDPAEGVCQAAQQVREAGHHMVLASGRSLIAMLPVARTLGIEEGWLVASNGAVTARLDPSAPGGYVLQDVATFDPGPALRVLREELPDARYAAEELGIGYRLNALFPDGELSGNMSVVSFEELCSQEVTRVVVRAPGSATEHFRVVVERLGLEDVTYAIGWTAWMDIAPHGVNKATGLEQVRRYLHVQPHRTVAIGDGHNDIDMLNWAARGVAMGHAEDLVKQAANEVTGSIAESGAVPVLRSLLG